ncbi:hypothetical protein QBC37DRAFT_321169 [Rhypophila decipiens]|uniref:Uncharacterized protein n=1 Tax=Rhypophila decipiens TaxID=261697 RepID=A0AAN6Y2H4_9PEZI|nr:hypothetical protein QBC37DRAFT_321169 [Rhypophila decipiens]
MAEVALGIIPIFLSACQGFTVLLDKIHLFRHYKREIHWLRLKVSVQSKCYKDEIRRLVIATLDTHKAQSLIADDNHSEWKDPDLENIFKQYMGDLFDDFLSAVKLIHEAQTSIQNRLDAFAPPDITSPRFRAVMDQFKLAFSRDRYKEDIETLKETIAELKTIRELAAASTEQEQLTARQQRAGNFRTPAPDIAVHIEMVKEYKAIRSLSSAFQDFLQTQWSCCCLSHSHHNGRLFLTSRPPKQHSLVWLLETAGKERHTTRVSNRYIFKVWSDSQPPGLLTPNSDTTFEPPRSPKRQRLSPQPPTLPGAHSQTCGLPRQQEFDESTVACLCKKLEAITLDSLRTQPHKSPLIHINTKNRELYRFEAQQIPVPVPVPVPKRTDGTPTSSVLSAISTWDLHEITYRPLSYLWGYKPEYIMSRRDRIQLAATLVRVTLTAHSTAGWPGHQSASVGCILEGIYFLIEGSVVDKSTTITIQSLLNTLHIPVNVGNSLEVMDNDSSDTKMTDSGESVSPRHAKATSAGTADSIDPIEEELKFTFGVRNLVLYRLGVALLSIARWERIQWQDIASVRKKAAALDWGGKAYKTAVTSLINCDFGAGDDLTKERLQFEVMRSVVGPLENSLDIISRSIDGGDILSSKNLDKVGGGWLEEPDRWVAQVRYETYPPHDVMGESAKWAWPPRAVGEIGEAGM